MEPANDPSAANLRLVREAIERMQSSSDVVLESRSRRHRNILARSRPFRNRNFNIMSAMNLAKVERMLQRIGCGVIVNQREHKLTIFYREPCARLVANRPVVVTSLKERLLLEQYGTRSSAEFIQAPYTWGRWNSALVWLRQCVHELIVEPHLSVQVKGKQLPVTEQEHEIAVKQECSPEAQQPAVVMKLELEASAEDTGPLGAPSPTNATTGSGDEEEEDREQESQARALSRDLSSLEEKVVEAIQALTSMHNKITQFKLSLTPASESCP